MRVRSLLVVLFLITCQAYAIAQEGSTMSAPQSPPFAPHAHTNRLAKETSPYLLQHAHNPVEWYAWGPEAFAAARAQHKPIFLSVGYSTCYWCHVMERESFESEAIAAIMNEHFINIKVDREERPDVDDVYMTAVQLMTGQGGWPMSVWLEPNELKPFYGGTYFPATEIYGRASFPQVLERIHEAWMQNHDEVMAQAENLAQHVRSALSEPIPQVAIDEDAVTLAVQQLLQGFDETYGGFDGAGAAPRFPQPTNLELLMGAAWDDEHVRHTVRHTLDRMAMGGMYDQVGGGFHRYSTDAKWLVPHFEKMLYDNAQLAEVYAESVARTGDAFHAEVLRETLEYVLREMTSDEGAFFSAQDAEVNAREGRNYLWTENAARAVLRTAQLDDPQTDFVLDAYGLSAGPNFRDPHDPDDQPKNVLYLIDHPRKLAAKHGVSLEEFNEALGRANDALYAVRQRREQPRLDDKTLTSWNGLMIAGFAEGGRVLDEDRYVAAAARAAEFILEHMRSGNGGLLRTSRHGEAKIDAFLEDYAFMIHGLLALHRATDDAKWLEAAKSLTEHANNRFRDPINGGYFNMEAEQSELFVRTRSTHDGAVPSGLSMMVSNLLTLHERTDADHHRNDAAAALRSVSGVLARRPNAMTLGALGLHRFLQAHDASLLAPRADAAARSQSPEIVSVAIDADQPSLALDQPVELVLTLTIAPPWHINAHEAGVESLIPLEVTLLDATGYTFEVEYPQGELVSDPTGEVRVHSGSVAVPMRITRQRADAGEPQLVITWQACGKGRCLAPQTQRVKLQFGR